MREMELWKAIIAMGNIIKMKMWSIVFLRMCILYKPIDRLSSFRIAQLSQAVERFQMKHENRGKS